jgi:hypothetical protein
MNPAESTMRNQKLIHLAGGLTVFLVAAATYLLTAEPTAGFWDSGEFITVAAKLQIGHPPGAPLYMLLGRFFAIFAGDPARIALSVNLLSTAASAFTILFLYLTITMLAGRIMHGKAKPSLSDSIVITGAGMTGALALAFSVTFWQSATEAEVYSLSTLFTAASFWAILKWESTAGSPFANRWLILIAYLAGLSIGVHLLSLLVIPAIVYVYYFRKYRASPAGFVVAGLASVALLAFILYGIVYGLPAVAASIELIMVNRAGLPFHSGIMLFVLLIAFLLVSGLVYTRKHGRPVLHTALLCLTMILIGYSSYTVILIRSAAGPPMDQNSPDNIFSLKSYLNREQYGNRPLFWGPYFNAPVTGEKVKTSHVRKDGRYEPVGRNFEFGYDRRFMTLFPRMYSPDPDHIEAYRAWGRLEGRDITVTGPDGAEKTITRPTFSENFRYFFSYQLGHMYARYLMWNFAGRQNDIQGHGRLLEGNWMSGIHPVDRMRLGHQYGIPLHLENNRGRNQYYLLPLVMGFIGLLFQLQGSKKDAWTVFLLFFFTGVAIVIWLNQTPYQPRERDYAYAGSFYAFAIWIGLGVLAVYDNLKKYLKETSGAVLSFLVPLLAIPGMMAAWNLDDNNRSGNYIARDFAWNYLQSCAPNSILFSWGDNDTFPLWYAQEVEGVRTDVRVVNLGYLEADWYIGQMKRGAYESDPLPLSMSFDQYIGGTRDIIYILDPADNDNGTPPGRAAFWYSDLREAVDFVLDDDNLTRLRASETEYVDYLPTRSFSLPADSARAVSTGTVSPERGHLVEPVRWSIGRNYITKSELVVLDLLAENNWERPVYFALTVPENRLLGLNDYLQAEGMAYRLVPVRKRAADGLTGQTDSRIMYENITEKFRWGNIYDPRVYVDETGRHVGSILRGVFARLASSLLDEGRRDSALVILDLAMEILPNEAVPFDGSVIYMIESYFLAGESSKASSIAGQKATLLERELDYYISLGSRFGEYVAFEKQRAFSAYRDLLGAVEGNDPELARLIGERLSDYYYFVMGL